MQNVCADASIRTLPWRKNGVIYRLQEQDLGKATYLTYYKKCCIIKPRIRKSTKHLRRVCIERHHAVLQDFKICNIKRPTFINEVKEYNV